jgi:hypothetical protein
MYLYVGARSDPPRRGDSDHDIGLGKDPGRLGKTSQMSNRAAVGKDARHDWLSGLRRYADPHDGVPEIWPIRLVGRSR